MSEVSLTMEVRVPPGRLFTHLASRWESGRALGGKGVVAGGRGTLPLMGDGVRLKCPGGRWALPRDSEVEVVDYRVPVGWRAVTDTEPELAWEVRIEAVEAGARLTCALDYRPIGLLARAQEALRGRRLRRLALRRLLEQWRKEAEREDALQRLRATALSSRPRSFPDKPQRETRPEPPGTDARGESLP